MVRWVSLVLALLVAENTIAAPPLEESLQPEVSAEETSAGEAVPGEDSSGLEESNAALLNRHGEIWGLMGLSAGAQEELNDTVVSINTGIYENRNEQPEVFKQVKQYLKS